MRRSPRSTPCSPSTPRTAPCSCARPTGGQASSTSASRYDLSKAQARRQDPGRFRRARRANRRVAGGVDLAREVATTLTARLEAKAAALIQRKTTLPFAPYLHGEPQELSMYRHLPVPVDDLTFLGRGGNAAVAGWATTARRTNQAFFHALPILPAMLRSDAEVLRLTAPNTYVNTPTSASRASCWPRRKPRRAPGVPCESRHVASDKPAGHRRGGARRRLRPDLHGLAWRTRQARHGVHVRRRCRCW